MTACHFVAWPLRHVMAYQQTLCGAHVLTRDIALTWLAEPPLLYDYVAGEFCAACQRIHEINASSFALEHLGASDG